MADQAEVTKLPSYVVIGTEDEINVSKMVMYVILEPGESGPDTSNKQGHVHPQIFQRRR